MKRVFGLVVLSSITFIATGALAQTSDEPAESPAPAAQAAPPQPARGPAPANVEKPTSDGAIPASTGFQMAIRTGVQVPFGEIGDGVKLNDFVSPQVPIHVELGGKPIPNLFIGGYLGLGIGGAGGTFADTCDRSNRTCASASFRVGVELQYHIAPEAKVNPWIGYGIGLASVAAGTGDVSLATAGPEYAHFMGGLDFRLSKAIGIGPFVDFSVGRYTTLTLKNGSTSYDGDIDKTALHHWLSIGARLVVFP